MLTEHISSLCTTKIHQAYSHASLVPRLVSYPGFLLTRGQKIEPGIKRSQMHQILHTFRVNHKLQDTCPVYVASRGQTPMLEQWWFAVPRKNITMADIQNNLQYKNVVFMNVVIGMKLYTSLKVL